MTDNNKNKIDTRAETLKQSLHSIGKFQVVEKIDFGSAGTVFKCYDPVLRVYCAIKVPFDQSAEVSQQLTEARLQARLDHPNILQIRNVEKIDGKWVIVMNYAEGGNLRQKLANPKMISINDAVDYTRQIAGGLKKAHEHKILHHDIKPENILFSSEDTPMITDFGIARIVQSAQKDMSKIIGTAAYMAPEMLEGKADLRSDIWSLGVVFYEMLTGVRCLEGESDPETIKKIVMERPLPARKRNPSIPVLIDKIVMRMLEKKPTDRYQSLSEVIEALESVDVEQHAVEKKKIGIFIPISAAVALFVAATISLTHKDNVGKEQPSTIKGVAEPERAESPEIRREEDAPEKPVVSNLRNEQKPGVDNGSKENRRDATAGQTQHTRIPADLINLPVAEQLKISSDYIEGDKFEAAHQLLSLVIEKTNDPLLKSEVKFKRASLALHYMDRPEHALADFIALIKESQDRAIVGDSHYFAGWIYYEKKNDLKNAVKHFQIVVETYPDNSNIGTARFFVDEASRRITGKGTK